MRSATWLLRQLEAGFAFAQRARRLRRPVDIARVSRQHHYRYSAQHASATQPTTDPAHYYLNAVTNHPAEVMHAHTVDGRAYGFPFDDVAGGASYLQDATPSG
ncbi:MAG: beta-1,3-glucanase family protein [Sciscionella sp.]